jgi:CRP-like cAMP-binding protein
MAHRAPDASALSAVPLLSGASSDQIQALADLLTVERVEAGTVLGREGELGREFWIVLEGEVAVSRGTPRGTQVLSISGPGSLLGELALLRHQPRNATVTAATAALVAAGTSEVLERLLTLPDVRSRLRRQASTRLAHNLRPVPARLADGTEILVRPLLPEDREAYDLEIHRQSREFMRRRFFSPGGPSDSLVDYLIDIDYVDHFAWVIVDAHDHRRGLAAARYVRTGDRLKAEMAFGTSEPVQGRGLGTFLFGALGVAAVEAGIRLLVAHVLEDNRSMRAVFAKAGARSRFEEPGVVFVEADPAAAAGLVDEEVRRALADSVHDVVTAASLALSPP